MRRLPILILALLALPVAGQPVSFDFSAAKSLDDLPALSGSKPATIKLVDLDGRRCLLVENTTPNKYDQVTVKGPFTLGKNLVLSFDVRAESDEPTNYVGVIFTGDDNKTYFGQTEFSGTWHHVDLPVPMLHPVDGGTFRLGMVFKSFQIYGRAKNDTGARMKVWLDKLTLGPKTTAGKLSDSVRISTANPPLFDWPRQPKPVTLAWSRDPAFPAGATTTVEVPVNWYLPRQPLEPGRWYWRYTLGSDLAEGWSDTQQVDITPEAHRYQAPPIPADFGQRPHPRLLDVKAERAKLGEKAIPDLIKEAEKIYKDNIADECPVWVAGDPRWPTWIEWYGKAHGGITSRAGTRMQRLGYLAMVTGDPKVRQYALELGLKAAKWDPNGGSSIKGGDIGFHHFLRGLNWIYDALADGTPAAELAPIAAALDTRAGIFWDYLNPFRRNEFNNHAWLCTLALGESGLVRDGEQPLAAQWAQWALDLYVGRFLCALGYQGDNNEGISYWGYGLSFVIEYAAMMRRVTGINLFQHPWLALTDRFPMYCAPPGGYAISFADTGQPNDGVLGPAETRQVLPLAQQAGDPYGMWYGGAREPADGVAPKPPIDLSPSIHYHFIGWSIFNTTLLDGRDGVTVAMRSGPFYAGHQHEDLNSFVIHAYGQKLAIDGGHYDWYGSPQFTKWSTKTRAHNTLLVNGQDQESRVAGGDGSIARWFDSPAFGYTVGRITSPKVYSGQVKQFDRRLLFVKPGLVIVHDLVDAAQGPARYDWLLHSVGELKTDPAKGAFALTSGGAGLAGRFLAPAGLGLKVTTGYPADAQPVDNYSTRPSPPEKTPLEYHLTATPAAPQVHEEFLTVMRVARGAASPEGIEPLAVENGVGATITDGGATTLVLSRKPGTTGALRGGPLSSDAELLCLRRYGPQRHDGLMVAGTWLKADDGHGEQTMIESTTPVTLGGSITPEGVYMAVSAPAATTLTLRGAQGRILVDGAAAGEARDGVARVELKAGEHEVAIGADPAALRSHTLPALQLNLNRQAQPLQGYARRTADGFEQAWWGPLTITQSDRYQLAVDGDARVSLDGQAVDPQSPRWLTAGPHFAVVTGARPKTLSLTGMGAQALDAEKQPTAFAPPAGTVTVEAEAVAAEGEVKGRIVEKVGASGGKGHCNWDTLGQWAEWTVTAPREGDYSLLIRGCGDDGAVLRILSLDGQPWPGGGMLRLAATGGWSRTSDDWRWFRVPKLVHLTAGTHRLRMEQAGGSMNLDQFAWVPAR